MKVFIEHRKTKGDIEEEEGICYAIGLLVGRWCQGYGLQESHYPSGYLLIGYLVALSTNCAAYLGLKRSSQVLK